MKHLDRLSIILKLLIVIVNVKNAYLIKDNSSIFSRRAEKSSVVPVEVLATPGETIVLPCDLEKSFRNVMWTKDDVLVERSLERYYWSAKKSSSDDVSASKDLRISNIMSRDGGVWQCQFQSGDQIVKAQPIKLVIALKPHHPILMYEDATIKQSSVISISEGDTLQLVCIVKNANPPVKHISWILDKTNVTSESKFTVEHDEKRNAFVTKSILRIENVGRQHNYKAVHCEVKHLLWTSKNPSVYAILDVWYRPSFVLGRSPAFGSPIIEGMYVYLHCKISANPPSIPSWVKDKINPFIQNDDQMKRSVTVVTGQDGFLNFTSIKRSDAGWYRCSTDHKLGHFDSFGYYLSVKHAPQIITQPPKRVEAALGDDVLLECGATGIPPPAYCWSRIRDRHSSKKLESLGIEQNLLLDRLLYTDTGTYKCTASSRIGMTEHQAQTHSIKLTVKGKPIIEPINRTVRVIIGRPASFSVKVCANPLPERIYWIIGHLSIKPGQIISGYKALNITDGDSADCFISSVEIDSVESFGAGEIIVIAKNIKGVNDGVIVVNFTKASYSISNGSSEVRCLFHQNIPRLLLLIPIFYIRNVMMLQTSHL